jgi:hypothetical protein
VAGSSSMTVRDDDASDAAVLRREVERLPFPLRLVDLYLAGSFAARVLVRVVGDDLEGARLGGYAMIESSSRAKTRRLDGPRAGLQSCAAAIDA